MLIFALLVTALLVIGCWLERFKWFRRLMDKGVERMTKEKRS